jgi:sugar lactone lactonase YvrE
MAQDSTGALYLSDAVTGRVYRIALDGTVSTFAGGGMQPAGFQSDGGPATAAALRSPRGLVFDSKGNLNIAEVFCNCIRRVSPDGTISTVYTLPPTTDATQLRFSRCRGLDDRPV